MKRKLIESYILNRDGRLTDYGLMMLARNDEEAFIGLKIDMGAEIENMVKYCIDRCDLEYAFEAEQVEEIRQRIYVRIVTKYSEKFVFERYKDSDGFYVKGWRVMDKSALLEEYKKYIMAKKGIK